MRGLRKDGIAHHGRRGGSRHAPRPGKGRVADIAVEELRCSADGRLGDVGVAERGKSGIVGVDIDEICVGVGEEEVQGQLGQSALGFGSEDGV